MKTIYTFSEEAFEERRAVLNDFAEMIQSIEESMDFLNQKDAYIMYKGSIIQKELGLSIYALKAALQTLNKLAQTPNLKVEIPEDEEGEELFIR